jgi:hypothetical protein
MSAKEWGVAPFPLPHEGKKRANELLLSREERKRSSLSAEKERKEIREGLLPFN